MNKWGCLGVMVALVCAPVAMACDGKDGAASAKTVASKACCAKDVKTTASVSKSECRSKGVASAQSGKAACKFDSGAATLTAAKGAGKWSCGTTVATVASKARCGSSAKKSSATVATAAARSGCSKPYTATTASAKSSCRGKAGRTLTSLRVGSDKVNVTLASMPAMTYCVGDFETRCSKSAQAKADETKQSMTFVVGEKTYDNKGEAMVALTGLLDSEAKTLATVRFAVGDKCFACPVSARGVAQDSGAKIKYRVAGFDFDDQATAKTVAKAVAEAAGKVAMTYKVDGKPTACAQTAKACGSKQLTYVVGDAETRCEATAKLSLAEAKIRAMIEAAAASLPTESL